MWLVAGAGQADLQTVETYTAPTANLKMALAMAANDFAFTTNGASALTDVSGTVPTGLTQLQIGAGLSATTLNGYIRRVAYIPSRLANAELQNLTT